MFFKTNHNWLDVMKNPQTKSEIGTYVKICQNMMFYKNLFKIDPFLKKKKNALFGVIKEVDSSLPSFSKYANRKFLAVTFSKISTSV